MKKRKKKEKKNGVGGIAEGSAFLFGVKLGNLVPGRGWLIRASTAVFPC